MPRAEAEAYLDDRAAKGFNVVQGVLAWGGGTGFEIAVPGPNYAGNAPWNGDPAHPNDAYFNNVDHLARYAAERDIVLAMLPTWGYYVNATQTLTPENARAYGRWLGARYRDQPNIIWVNGGDRIPTGFEDTYRALAEGLREGDGGAHLITYHPCGWRSSGQFWHQEPWLDFNMIQTWTDWAKIYPAVAADYARTPIKPVVLAEPAYENGPEYPQGPITPHVLRREAWWAVMAGGFFTYGQNQNWRMEPGWLAELTSAPGAAQMTILKSIMASRPWWTMTPDQGLFEWGVGEGPRPQRRAAVGGRPMRDDLPEHAVSRVDQRGQDRGARGAGNLDQPGHRRRTRGGHPCHRQLRRARVPEKGPRPVLRARFLGRRGAGVGRRWRRLTARGRLL